MIASARAMAIRPAGGAALWRGPQLEPLEAHTYRLTNSDVLELDEALARAPKAAAKRSCPMLLPQYPLATTLAAIRDRIATGRGFWLLRGFPVERYDLMDTAALLLAMGLHLGRPAPQNSRGDLLTAVRNAGLSPAVGAVARGYQSGLALPFHSDSCDTVGLLCIRSARSGGSSSIASAYAVHNAMFDQRPDLLHALYRPFYIDRHSEASASATSFYATPVFMRHRGRLFCRFNPGYVYSAQRHAATPRLTRQQLDAMEAFKQHCDSPDFKLTMELRPGDLQLLDNNVLVHARSSYRDHRAASRRRHLLRLWLLTSQQADVPRAMRERYRDMACWKANAHMPTGLG